MYETIKNTQPEGRYIVKQMLNKELGVYDTENACFPRQGPELRIVGISYVGWMKPSERAKAEEIVALLNEADRDGRLPGSKPIAKSKAKSKATKNNDEDEAAFRAMAEALVG